MTTDNDEIERRLAALVTAILPPLRADKTLDEAALTRLRELVVELGADGRFASTIPTSLAGTLWFVYYSMLDEAHHARDPLPIIRAASAYQEDLRRHVFGPRFGG